MDQRFSEAAPRVVTPRLRAIRAAALALLAVVVSSCSLDEPSRSGSLAVTVSGATSGVSRVVATLTSASMPARQVELAAQGSWWSATIDGLPIEEVSVGVEALDAEGAATHRGSGSVTIQDGGVVALQIVAREVNDPPSYGNTPPRIDAVTVSATIVRPGDSVSIGVQASDPDPGAVLTIGWSASGGTFEDATQAATQWVAPPVEGLYDITVVVRDELDASATAHFLVRVGVTDPPSGALELNVILNSSPRILQMGVSPSRGYSTQLTATVVDPDADTLWYEWSATCAGTFTDPMAKDTSFYAQAPTQERCTLSLLVTDKSGNQNLGWIGFWVGAPPPVETPDEILRQLSCGSATVEVARPRDPCTAGFYTRLRADSALTIGYVWIDGSLHEGSSIPYYWSDWLENFEGTLGHDWTTYSLAGLETACGQYPQGTWVTTYLALDITECGFVDLFDWWQARP